METNLMCAFCNEKWNGDILARSGGALFDLGLYDGDCPILEDIDFEIKIFCHKCEKLLYSKEVNNIPHDSKFHISQNKPLS